MSLISLLHYSALAASRNETLVRHISNEYKNIKYDAVLIQSELDGAPFWADGEKNPPLSIGDAIKSATNELQKLIPESREWPIDKIILEPGGRTNQWIYVICFTPEVRGAVGGVVLPFRVIVLMSGEVVRMRPIPKPGAKRVRLVAPRRFFDIAVAGNMIGEFTSRICPEAVLGCNDSFAFRDKPLINSVTEMAHRSLS